MLHELTLADSSYDRATMRAGGTVPTCSLGRKLVTRLQRLLRSCRSLRDNIPPGRTPLQGDLDATGSHGGSGRTGSPGGPGRTGSSRGPRRIALQAEGG